MLNADVELINDDEHYRDVDVYVTDSTGAEWLFRVYLSKHEGEIIHGQPRYSPDNEESFEDTSEPPPPDVQDAFNAAMPEVLSLLKNGGSHA